MCYDPDQYTEPQSGLTPRSVESELINWIDPSVIAENIIEEMIEQRVPVTLDLAKRVWLDALKHLHDQVGASVDGVRDEVRC